MDTPGFDPPSSAPPAPAGRADKALERASAAPLRAGNRLDLPQNGPDTYEGWLS